MASPLPYPIHPIAAATAQIAQGEDPWFALGSFLHDWWCYAVEARADLITVPPTPGTTLEENAGPRFVRQRSKSYVQEQIFLSLYGQANKTTFSNSPGFMILDFLNENGCSQQHLSRFSFTMSLLVAAFLTKNMNFDNLSRNLDGQFFQMSFYKN